MNKVSKDQKLITDSREPQVILEKENEFKVPFVPVISKFKKHYNM